VVVTLNRAVFKPSAQAFYGPAAPAGAIGGLRLRRLGIDTCQDLVVYLRSDSQISKSEGFEAQSRVELWRGATRVLGTVNVVHRELLAIDEIGLSEAAWRALGGTDGELVNIAHAPELDSFSMVREKIYGRAIVASAARAIVGAIVAGPARACGRPSNEATPFSLKLPWSNLLGHLDACCHAALRLGLRASSTESASLAWQD
jgi:hypothetical protein